MLLVPQPQTYYECWQDEIHAKFLPLPYESSYFLVTLPVAADILVHVHIVLRLTWSLLE